MVRYNRNIRGSFWHSIIFYNFYVPFYFCANRSFHPENKTKGKRSQVRSVASMTITQWKWLAARAATLKGSSENNAATRSRGCRIPDQNRDQTSHISKLRAVSDLDRV